MNTHTMNIAALADLAEAEHELDATVDARFEILRQAEAEHGADSDAYRHAFGRWQAAFEAWKDTKHRYDALYEDSYDTSWGLDANGRGLQERRRDLDIEVLEELERRSRARRAAATDETDLDDECMVDVGPCRCAKCRLAPYADTLSQDPDDSRGTAENADGQGDTVQDGTDSTDDGGQGEQGMPLPQSHDFQLQCEATQDGTTCERRRIMRLIQGQAAQWEGLANDEFHAAMRRLKDGSDTGGHMTIHNVLTMCIHDLYRLADQLDTEEGQ